MLFVFLILFHRFPVSKVIADGYKAVDKWRQSQANEDRTTYRVCIGTITSRVEVEYIAKTTNKYYDSKNYYHSGEYCI